ncbi:hypothetical protein R5R35_010727 [Gryllus longicercus]|uniref:Uncharacterized protein n=1 Tax=Gryllus longicercus TaxID=2509291 RepID=A0AAN9YZT2_9ORTH
MAEQKKVEDAERRERLLRYVRSQQMNDTSLNDTGEHVPDDVVHDPFRPITEVVGNNSKSWFAMEISPNQILKTSQKKQLNVQIMVLEIVKKTVHYRELPT